MQTLGGRAQVPRTWGAVCTAVALSVPFASGADGTITKEELAARYSGLEVKDIRDSVVPGFYEVRVANGLTYVSSDGRYLFRGEIVDLASNANLTAQRLAADRAELLAAIDPAKEIVFSPPDGNVKHRITVFTDVDCGYCRQLHREIAETNAIGIEVRYVSYPRTGPNTDSWRKAENVWCSTDRQANLTQAKLGADIAATEGCTSPVAEQYSLGHRVGVTGTPAVYTDKGVEIGGYLSPQELLARLDQLAAKP